MISGKTPKSGHMGYHTMSGANVTGQVTHPSSAAHTERNVVNATKTTTLRWNACPHSRQQANSLAQKMLSKVD